MKLRKLKLPMLLMFMFTAVLALTAVYNFQTKSVEAGVQDQSQSDVKAPTKTRSAPPAPQGVAPANDNCANAISVNACPFTDSQDTAGAGDEVGEPQSTCTAQENSVWYTLPPSANRRNVTVDTCGSDFDTAVMIWEVNAATPCNFASFVAIACNDDFGGCGDGFQSSLAFSAQANTTYKIQVGGFAGETGSLVVNVNCAEILCDDIVITGALGSGSPNFDGVQFSTTQNGRLNRNGIASTCAAPKTCLLFTAVGARAADVFQIPNESGEDACVNVNLTIPNATGCNLQSNAYLGSFNGNSICLNYLGDPGLSTGTPPTPTNFSVVVPAGQTLVLVVHAVDPGTGVGCAYTLTVTGNLCEQFDFCVQDDNIPGRFIKINSTTGAYEYNDCSKGVILTGTGTVTISFCKVQLTHAGPNPKRPDRSVNVLLNPCTARGDAQIRPPGTFNTAIIGDSNIFNNTCECP